MRMLVLKIAQQILMINDILKKAQALTDVQKKILDACEPLIKDLQDRAEQWMDSALKRFEVARSQETRDIDKYRFMREFARNDDQVFSLISSTYGADHELSYLEGLKLKNFKLISKSKQKYFQRVKEQIRIYNVAKLTVALVRYVTPEFTEVKNIRLSRGAKGFEILAELTDNQNRHWSFNTRAIGAGGYNIQIWHYRYIINLTSPDVPKQIIRQRITEKEKSEKIQKQQERQNLLQEKKRINLAKKIASLFYVVRGEINNWNTWLKEMIHDQLIRGQRTQKEVNEKEQEIERLKTFNNKFPFKRPQLVEKVLNKEISIATFDEVRDLIEDKYEYRNVLRESQQLG